MHQSAAVITAVCLLICLSFNYTFPLLRGSKSDHTKNYSNQSGLCMRYEDEDVLAPSYKITNNQEHLEISKKSLNEQDIIQYEQLVIMKKYPYLDLKEMEPKFSSSSKNVRHSAKVDSGTNFEGDSSICESIEDGLNVEIINRGLSGFAIPAKLIRGPKLLDARLKQNNIKYVDAEPTKVKLPNYGVDSE